VFLQLHSKSPVSNPTSTIAATGSSTPAVLPDSSTNQSSAGHITSAAQLSESSRPGHASKATSEGQENEQELGQALGMSEEVAKGKNKEAERVSTIWKGPHCSLLAIHRDSMSRMRPSPEDYPMVYQATLDFLVLRRQDTGPLSITVDTPLPPDVHFHVDKNVRPPEWLQKLPSQSFFY
jgi:hypothetical protein